MISLQKFPVDDIIEKSIIVTALMKADALPYVLQLNEDYFYSIKYKKMFKAMKQLHQSGTKCEIMNLRDRIIKNNDFKYVGGDEGITEVYRGMMSYDITSTIKQFLDISKRRKMLEETEKLQDSCCDRTKEISTIINDHKKIVKELEINETENEFFTIDPLNLSVEEHFIKTGFESLDKILYGFFDCELIVLAGRPGTGKSALALDMAWEIAKKDPVLFYSLEMPIAQLQNRVIAREARVEMWKLRTNKLTVEDTAKVEKVKQLMTVPASNLYLVSSKRKVEHIITSIEKYISKQKPSIVFIDYLQLIGGGVGDNRDQRIGSITKELKTIANSEKIPIVALSQLRRKTTEGPPTIEELRESGNIEQDADIVLLMYAPDGGIADVVKTEVAVGKARNGPVGVTVMDFEKKYFNFLCREDSHRKAEHDKFENLSESGLDF